jgi:hypothetical protein
MLFCRHDKFQEIIRKVLINCYFDN